MKRSIKEHQKYVLKHRLHEEDRRGFEGYVIGIPRISILKPRDEDGIYFLGNLPGRLQQSNNILKWIATFLVFSLAIWINNVSLMIKIVSVVFIGLATFMLFVWSNKQEIS